MCIHLVFSTLVTLKGGGVAVLCKNDLKVKLLNFIETPYMEIVWCKISTQNWEYYVASVYHPPGLIYEACELLDFLSDSCDQILHDDPNAKIISPCTRQSNPGLLL